MSAVDAYVMDKMPEPLPRSRPYITPVDLGETLVPQSLPLQEKVE